MPTTYAHWRFGEQCIGTLPENLQQIVLANREVFDLGVHGPDIFFYDLTHRKVARYGSNLHHDPARGLFDHFAQVYQQQSQDQDIMLSYILGFLSHYTLDSQCHGYINKKTAAVEGLSHNKIEAEYDGHLMRLDGRSIPQFDRAESLRPNRKICEVMSRLFPFDGKVLYRTCKDQQFIISALNCHSDLKRNGLHSLLYTLKLTDFGDLLVMPEELEICKDANLRIDKLSEYALELYPELVRQMMARIEENKELGSYFERDFDPVAGDETPILSYSEELNYIPEKDR